jgi:hypothetical protein
MNGTKNLGVRSDGADTYLYGECRFNEDPWAYKRSEIRLDDFLGDEHVGVLYMLTYKNRYQLI